MGRINPDLNYVAFLKAGINVYRNGNQEAKWVRRQQHRVKQFYSLGQPICRDNVLSF